MALGPLMFSMSVPVTHETIVQLPNLSYGSLTFFVPDVISNWFPPKFDGSCDLSISGPVSKEPRLEEAVSLCNAALNSVLPVRMCCLTLPAGR
jgi:hypothetical protein